MAKHRCEMLSAPLILMRQTAPELRCLARPQGNFSLAIVLLRVAYVYG